MTLRPFRWNDLSLYTSIVREARKADGADSAFTEETAGEYLRQPNLTPERDCFLAEVDGDVVGFTLVVPELDIGRTIIEGAVRSAHRRRGIGAMLMERAIEHSKGLGAGLAHASTALQGVAVQRLLEGTGFVEASRQWQMRLELADLIRGRAVERYEIRHMAAGQEEVLTELQNRAFTGSWGFAPNVTKETVYRTRMGGGRPEDTLFLVADGRPVAYCWTKMLVQDGVRVGIVWMIGAVPEIRGRGFGRAMLLESIDFLAAQGAKAVELTVYQDNAPAVELYKATGFRPKGEYIWYELRL